MNYLDGVVSNIENCDSLHIVEFAVENEHLYMMSLEIPTIHVGLHVRLAIKPLSIAIAKRFLGSISFSNKLFATVKQISEGVLLCSVKLDFKTHELEAVLRKKALENMHLKVGDSVVLFIKASDVFIKEVL
ncbi:MAG: TOBE domain-containing protein [Sulfurospirillum sp.]|nr:TOBE domain-containing protein [Sulfurospirillum sp.]